MMQDSHPAGGRRSRRAVQRHPSPWAGSPCPPGEIETSQGHRQRCRRAGDPSVGCRKGTGTWAECIWIPYLRHLFHFAAVGASSGPILLATSYPTPEGRVSGGERLSMRCAMMSSDGIATRSRERFGRRVVTVVDGLLETEPETRSSWRMVHSCALQLRAPGLRQHIQVCGLCRPTKGGKYEMARCKSKCLLLAVSLPRSVVPSGRLGSGRYTLGSGGKAYTQNSTRKVHCVYMQVNGGSGTCQPSPFHHKHPPAVNTRQYVTN